MLRDAPSGRTCGTHDHIDSSGPKDLTTSRADPNPVSVVGVLTQDRRQAILHFRFVPGAGGID
jgi:hypothetical protein